MRFGLAISVFMHVALLAWAMWAVLTTPRHDLPDTPPIDVAIITPSELTRLRQGDPDSKEMTAKAEEKPSEEISKREAPKPKPVTAPEPPKAAPPPPEPEAAKPEPPKPEPEKKAEPDKPDPIAEKLAAVPPPPEPAPGPSPEELKKLEEQKKAEAEAEAKKRAEEQKKADDKKKAEEKKKKAEEAKKKAEEQKKKLAEARRKAEEAKKKLQFDPDRIAALLDKSPDKKGAPSKSNAPDPNSTNKGPTAGTRDGRDSVLSVREQDLLLGLVRAQLRNCWRLPGGGGGATIPIVTLRWRLNPDGSLNGVPQVEGGGSGPMYQVAVDTAMRAVHECAPFTLPPDKYDAWKELIWDFDPTRML